MGSINYYEVLGINRNSTSVEIRLAFLKLAKKYHPDVNKEAEAEELFKAANEAYSVLSDKEKRSLYDMGQSVMDEMKLKKPSIMTTDKEFHLMAVWYRAIKTNGPVMIETGEGYRVKKDENGFVSAEVRLDRFPPRSQYGDVLIMGKNFTNPQHFGLKDWVNIGEVNYKADGIYVPTEYQNLIRAIELTASKLANGSNLSPKDIEDLNKYSSVCFSVEQKHETSITALADILDYMGEKFEGSTKQPRDEVSYNKFKR